MQAPGAINGFHIHSSTVTCVCVSSQVYNKLQMVYGGE